MERGPLAARAEELESDGRSVSWIAATSPKKRLIGLLAFGDEAKTSAKEAIEILHRRGVRSIMLTGDNAGSANAVAKQLGIDEVIANVLPEGKADAVASLRGEDRTVAMVGDRSEEHTSELQSLMRISYAVFCLKKTKKKPNKS